MKLPLRLLFLLAVFSPTSPKGQSSSSYSSVKVQRPNPKSRSPPPSSTIFDFSRPITIDDILDAIRSNRTDCQTIARIFLARIRLYNGRLGAVTVLNYRGALSDARQLDSYRRRSNGRLFGRLHCVPTLVKDNILVAGLPTTLGLWMFANATAKMDARAVWRLRSEGALILGKANLAPFSITLKSADEPSEISGHCRNPYTIVGGDRSWTTVSGSSCGNAVAQAARLSVIGLGTDTAGSVTWPASECGVVGVRPQSKIYDTHGVFPLLKQAGDSLAPVAHTVKDAALVLDVISVQSGNRSRQLLSQHSSRRPDGRPYRIGLLRDLTYARSDSPLNTSRVDGRSYEYWVDGQFIGAVDRFVLSMASNVSVVNLSLGLEEFSDHIHRIHRAWTDVFACTPQWIDAFLHKHPFVSKRRGLRTEIASLDEMLEADGLPGHYRRFFQTFSKHKSHCLPSIRKLRKARTEAKRILQKRIFETDDVDVVAFPRPHRFRSDSIDSDSSLVMLDPAGALGFPAMSLPIGFATREGGGSSTGKSKNDRRRAAVGRPIGLYLMTRPRKFKAMLDIGRIYERLVSDHESPSFLPPEFV